MAMTISMGKTYRTRPFMGFSSEVRIFMTDAGTNKAVIGAYRVEQDGEAWWQTGRWTMDGRWFGPDEEDPEPGNCSLDLIEVEAKPDEVKISSADGCALHPLGCMKAVAARRNIKAGWDALSTIREFVEDIAPAGTVPNAEYADNPEPMTEAEMICKGIAAIAEQRSAA